MTLFNFPVSTLIATTWLGHSSVSGAAIIETNSSLRASSQRSLQAGAENAVSLVEAGDGSHVVKVSQTLFGATPGVCEDGADNQAWMMFATYLDHDTLEPTCGFFERNVGACFEKTMAIGCDPKTNTATLDLYVRDETLPGSLRTDNPKIGRCKVGTGAEIARAIRISETIECISAGPSGNGPSGNGSVMNTCSDTHNSCLEGFYCNFSETRGYECKSYVPVGTRCGGFTLLGEENRCNPSDSYCYYPYSCQIADAPGTCQALLGACKSSTDCGEGEYCDTEVSQCKEQLVEGDCCSVGMEGQCSGGFCNLDQFGGNVCMSYEPTGSVCGGYTKPGLESRCDPSTSFCFYSKSCVLPDASGECIPFGSKCIDDKGCQADEYCDPQHKLCKPRLSEGDCCDLKNDLCSEGTFCDKTFEGSLCKAYAAVGDSCGGLSFADFGSNVCDPKTSYCFSGEYCEVMDLPGKCLPYKGACKSEGDCLADEYCDLKHQQCKARLEKGTCCEETLDQCLNGLVCRNGQVDAKNSDVLLLDDWVVKCRDPL